MTNHDQPSVPPDSQSPVVAALKHVGQVLLACWNMKWNDAKPHLDRIAATAAAAPPGEKASIELLHTIASDCVLGLQFWMPPANLQKKTAAMKHSMKAQAALCRLKEQQPEAFSQPLLRDLLVWLSAQAIAQQGHIARIEGDTLKAQRLEKQLTELIDKAIGEYEKESPIWHSLYAKKRLREALQAITSASDALIEMRTPDAKSHMEQCSKCLEFMKTHLDKSRNDTEMSRLFTQEASGYLQIAMGMERYAKALHAAIAGTIEADEIKELKQAEKDFEEGAPKIQEVNEKLPGFSSAPIVEAARRGATMSRNLLRLCEQSPRKQLIVRTIMTSLCFTITFTVLCMGATFLPEINRPHLPFFVIMASVLAITSAIGPHAVKQLLSGLVASWLDPTRSWDPQRLQRIMNLTEGLTGEETHKSLGMPAGIDSHRWAELSKANNDTSPVARSKDDHLQGTGS